MSDNRPLWQQSRDTGKAMTRIVWFCAALIPLAAYWEFLK